MPRYKVADIIFDARLNYDYVEKLCKKYEYSGLEQPHFSVSITDEDILNESVSDLYPKWYLESLALFRKLCEYALNNADGLVFHSSAIMVDGNAYLFTAPSGTGKSTHTRLWREMLGDRAVMVNDDKPLIRYENGEFYIYGTPWNGKHHLDTDCKAKIKAICHIYQNKENVICKADKNKMLVTILNQTIRPKDISSMDKLLGLIDKLLTTVDIYSLGCNISREAAELSFNTMSGANKNEN
ncbi:MAG: hypothetical protein J6U92_01675 [Clostridia bacterium]|nr:hypothetical protein [Clostridia bacterium]